MYNQISSELAEHAIVEIDNYGDLIVMQFGIVDWLECMIECPDRIDAHCTMTGKSCLYAQCPGNNMELDTDTDLLV